MSDIFCSEGGIVVSRKSDILLMQWSFGSIEYNIGSGLAKIFKPGETVPVLSDIYAQVLINGEIISSYNLSRGAECVNHTVISDGFGTGIKVMVKGKGEKFSIVQNFYLYQNRNYFLFDTVVEIPGGGSTNCIAALKAGKEDNTRTVIALNPSTDPRFLFVPWDNDEFVRYDAKAVYNLIEAESYEVTAVFDNTSRNGFVTGSISHDTWKTGIRVSVSNGSISRFNVFSGITSFETRDTEDSDANREVMPHGSISGTALASAKMFFGFFDDWRDGMEEYGKANGIVAPPLSWSHGPPFGWNSWSAVAFNLDYNIFTGASDFVRNKLPGFKNGKNANYINFDATAKITEEQRVNASEYVKANLQNPGIYHTPFTCWHREEDDIKKDGPGGQDQYKWYDLILKDQNGKPQRYMHGKGWALDPTHPGVVAHNERTMKQFRGMGFRYAKLDFLSHGAMEGVHYDRNITTGIQAYNYGMKKLLEALGDDMENGNFFISLSIAPVFPAHYAHGRRISCDVFGEIGCSEYMLNSLNYGWWLNNYVYPYNDPDHIVVYTSFNRPEEKGPILFGEGMSRYLAAAITGGFMINSDDIRTPDAAERVIAILNNEEVNALAASGRTFRPVEGNTDNKAGELFVRDDRHIDGRFYLAAFNFSDTEEKDVNVDLQRAGLDTGKKYSVREISAHKDTDEICGSWVIKLGKAEPKLFILEEK